MSRIESALKRLAEGCFVCAYHYPDEFEHDEWGFELNKMQPKAKINDAEKELILKYLWNAPQKKKVKS